MINSFRNNNGVCLKPSYLKFVTSIDIIFILLLVYAFFQVTFFIKVITVILASYLSFRTAKRLFSNVCISKDGNIFYINCKVLGINLFSKSCSKSDFSINVIGTIKDNSYTHFGGLRFLMNNGRGVKIRINSRTMEIPLNDHELDKIENWKKNISNSI